MRTGVRLGIDVGKARIGVARCDPHGMIATPLETVPRDRKAEREKAIGEDTKRILELAREFDVIELVVGLPLGLSGLRTPSTDDAEVFARGVASTAAEPNSGLSPVTVRLVDERLSTVTAQGQLRQAGKKTKQTRHVIDQVAAVVILQHALDSERTHGNPPGTVVEVESIESGSNDTPNADGEKA